MKYLVLGALILLASGPLTLAQQQTTIPTLEVIARLNEWRIGEGLWPLRPNETLEALALLQAEYVLSLPSIPQGGAIHTGSTGEGPMERAQFTPFNWPTYGNPERIAIGEIAAIGGVDFALDFWHNSETHRNTVLNPAYREVGVAALPHRFGYLFIVVMGARPNVLPALADPRGNIIYLSNERYEYATGDGWIGNADRIRLFDADGRPLQDDWIPWSETVNIPDGSGDQIFVLYTDGNIEVLAEVEIGRNAALLPGYVPTVEPTQTPMPTASNTPIASPRVPDTPTPVNEASPAPTQESTIAPPTPTAKPRGPELLILYDNRSLTVLNVADQTVDVSGLELVGGAQSLPIEQWTRATDVPLTAFPAGTCVQVWSWLEAGAVEQPEACRIRWSVLTIAPERFFWMEGNFEVRQNGRTVATCTAGAGQCAVDLPDIP